MTRKEYENRRALLNKVRNYWIKGVLEKSLYKRLKIELGLEERLDAIATVWETPEHERQVLEPGTKAIAKFDELGFGRTLLILGKPGSGKTTTLLELAQELIDRAEKDPKLPIPVVFNLSSWNQKKEKIEHWMIQEFETGIYKVSKEISENWIQKQQLLLLLDGLDEVRQELREACVEAINQFSQEHGQTEMIVCSRIKAYEALSQPLRFQTALYLNCLTSEQIEEYLTQAGEELSGIKLALQTDSVLQELAQSPLMLSSMVLAYEDMPASAFAQMNLEERQQHIWDRYINRMLERKQEDSRYPQNVTLNWLGFLAQQMIRESQTLFLIEHINPDWLKPRLQRRLYPLTVGLLAGLFIEWMYGFPLGLIAGQLSFQMLIGLMSGVALGTLGSWSSNIRLFTAMGWTWSVEKAWKAITPGLLSGPLIGILIWLIGQPLGLVSRSFLYYLTMGSCSGIVIALLSALFTGLVSSHMGSKIDASLDTFADTNQGIWQSGIRAGVATLFTLASIILPIAILYSWFLPLSAFLACVSLYAGGMACLQHLTIRFLLWQNRNLPWNYTNFLNYSAERMLLQKSGGGYQFIHDLLRRKIALRQNQERLQKSKGSTVLKPKLFLIYTALIAILISGLLLPFLINTWKVPFPLEQIFAPRLYQGDRLLVERVSYRFKDPQRWDIVSFQPTPEMRHKGFNYRSIKQILGFQGEEVAIIHGKVYVNGKVLENRVFVPPSGFREYGPVKIPKEMYLVTINNPEYNNLKDEFTIHLIPKNYIDGRVMFRFWPPDRVGLVP